MILWIWVDFEKFKFIVNFHGVTMIKKTKPHLIGTENLGTNVVQGKKTITICPKPCKWVMNWDFFQCGVVVMGGGRIVNVVNLGVLC